MSFRIIVVITSIKTKRWPRLQCSLFIFKMMWYYKQFFCAKFTMFNMICSLLLTFPAVSMLVFFSSFSLPLSHWSHLSYVHNQFFFLFSKQFFKFSACQKWHKKMKTFQRKKWFIKSYYVFFFSHFFYPTVKWKLFLYHTHTHIYVTHSVRLLSNVRDFVNSSNVWDL